MIKKHWLYTFLFLGLLTRIIISFVYYSGDIPTHVLWGKIGAIYGLRGLYEVNFMKLYHYTSPNYPPFILIIFTLFFFIKQWIFQIIWFLNIHLPFFPSKLVFFLKEFDYYPYTLKLPAIISDVGLAWVSYLFAKRLVKNNTSKFPVLVLLFGLFNPAYFYNSAYWGQTDSIPLFFLLSAVYLLLFSKRSILSALLFTTGMLFKQTTVVFFPLFLGILYSRFRLRHFVYSLLASSILFVVSFIPFAYLHNALLYPFLTYWHKILSVSGLPFTSNHAFNLWFLFTGSRKVVASSPFLFGFSAELWGYLMVGILYLTILFKLIKDKWKIESILFAGYLIPFAGFLFLTKMHERHLILTLPFLLLLTYKNRFFLITFIFISLFNFLNMYHNWWSPHFYPLEKLLSYPIVLNTLTFILLLLFFISLNDYVRGHVSPKKKRDNKDSEAKKSK